MSERRRRKLVDRFQHKLIVRIVVYWTIYQLTLWNFLFCWRLLSAGRGNLVEQYVQFCREFYPMFLCFLIMVPAFAWDSVKFYHRIAGPIWRFRKMARDIAREQPVRHVRLRTGDELKEMEEDFNLMLDTLARRGGVTLLSGDGGGTKDDQLAGIAIAACDPTLEDASHAAS